MLLPLLAAAALSASTALAPAPRLNEAMRIAETTTESVVMLDCLVSGLSLTDCKVVSIEPTQPEAGAQALEMARQIEVPASLAEADPGRIRIKLNVTP